MQKLSNLLFSQFLELPSLGLDIAMFPTVCFSSKIKSSQDASSPVHFGSSKAGDDESNKLAKLGDAKAISESENINHSLTDSLTQPLTDREG